MVVFWFLGGLALDLVGWVGYRRFFIGIMLYICDHVIYIYKRFCGVLYLVVSCGITVSIFFFFLLWK